MPLEFSSGAVVFRKERGKPLYLILHYEEGHWDFPKGRIEKRESISQAAKREIAEETGITKAKFIPGFKQEIHYALKREGKKTAKTVYFQLAETKQKKVRLSHEHAGFKWMAFGSAKKKLTYDNAKRLLEKANKFLETEETAAGNAKKTGKRAAA